jgi:hypothetical protein
MPHQEMKDTAFPNNYDFTIETGSGLIVNTFGKITQFLSYSWIANKINLELGKNSRVRLGTTAKSKKQDLLL